MINTLIFLIGTALMYSSPLVFTALGGMITERAGIVNIGVDGLMTLGAFVGAAVGYFTGNVWLALIVAGLVCMALSSLHAVATVTFCADQTVVGAAMNFIAPGIALFACKLLFDGSTSTLPGSIFPKIFGDLIPGDSYWSYLNVNVLVILAFLTVLLFHFLLYKTKWGLRVRAVGEFPEAAETAGVNVNRTKFVCVLLSGLLAGIGGATMTLSVVSMFSAIVVVGQGFIALAAVICGKWKPIRTYLVCLLFGFANALVVAFTGTFIADNSILFATLPYVLTIVVLVLTGSSNAPKTDGAPYMRNFH